MATLSEPTNPNELIPPIDWQGYYESLEYGQGDESLSWKLHVMVNKLWGIHLRFGMKPSPENETRMNAEIIQACHTQALALEQALADALKRAEEGEKGLYNMERVAFSLSQEVEFRTRGQICPFCEAGRYESSEPHKSNCPIGIAKRAYEPKPRATTSEGGNQ